ncbi:amidohydrolase [Phenylobacterium sp. LjRoot164]|uniref:amidohydrolase n=1 Tax=unclassified Phenylobacterium TaxID=2640670 RepID=UPI003ECC1ADE
MSWGTRRDVMLGGAAALAAGSRAFAAEGDAVYFGGPILTMDDARPRAEALAVRGGRILAVGGRDEVLAKAGRGARQVDLGGRALLPGFVDPHGHVSFVGLQAISANLLPAPDGEGNSVADLQRVTRAWMEANRPFIDRYKLVMGFGYDDSQLREQRHPTRRELDEISAEVPVLFIHQSGHLGVANSKALEAAGISAATPDPQGGVFRREPGGREPNGVMEEHAFMGVMGKLLSRLDLDANLKMIAEGVKLYTSYGYTTCQDGKSSSGGVKALQLAASRGMLTADVVAYPDVLTATDVVKAPLWGPSYKDRFRVGGVKLSIDGSPQGKTAWLSQPYFVPPEGQSAAYAGYPAVPVDQCLAAIDQAFANGWQILVHANGDAAIDVLIAGVREATRKYGPGDRRPVLIHGQTAREDQVDACKALGIIPSFFPMHTFYWGDWHRDSVLGPVRAENISPTGWALRRGMMFTTHHDAPVAKPDSIRVLSATVTRRTRSGDILGPHQRVPVDVALKAMTIWPAYQHFEEATKGSLVAGKLADFALLSQDPTAVDPEKLAALKVVKTIKEGVSIWRG